ncbi:MAG: hypothetical protein V1676_00785 [Candidatus Diapherotrites archaeon]
MCGRLPVSARAPPPGGRLPVSALFLALLIVLAADVHAPVMDVNAAGLNFQVTTINLWDNSADWNIFFQQSLGGLVTQLYDENRAGTTNFSSTNEFDRWYATISGSGKQEINDASARLWKMGDLNSRAQIVSESAFYRCSGGLCNFDVNTYRVNSIYPIGRTETGHGIVRWVVHMEMTDTNLLKATTDYNAFHHAISVGAPTKYDFNSFTDNNVGAPGDAEWWHGQQYTRQSGDANQVFVIGYSPNRVQRFFERLWNPTSANQWVSDNCINLDPNDSCWNDNNLYPQFNAGEMEYLNYVIFLTDTNWFTSINGNIYALTDENRIDYVMQDWRNPDTPFMQKGVFSYFDFNVGAYDMNADMNRVDFNMDTRGTKNSYNEFYSDMNTMDTNRYRPAFVVRNYTADAVPEVKINGRFGTYDVNYMADVNWAADYAVVVWYGDLTLPDQNVQLQIGYDINAPAVSITSPSVGSSTAATSMNIKYWGIDMNTGIKKYYVRMDAGDWIDNNVSITKNFLGLGAGEHTAYVIATDNADNNSAQASVTFTLTAPALTIRHLDVNATGANFEVGTADFNVFFQQSEGGCITKVVDLNRDSAKKNLSVSSGSEFFDHWFGTDSSSQSRTEGDDNASQLWKAEDLNSRVKITSSGALTRWGAAGESISGTSGQIYDLNFLKTTTIYPIVGGFRLVIHDEFTDVNSAATDYGWFYHGTEIISSTFYTYSDNNWGGTGWGAKVLDKSFWRGMQRYDLNSDFDANTVIVIAYEKPTSQKFFNGKWDPSVVVSNWGLPSSGTYWADSTLSDFSAGEMDYINYTIILIGTKEFGQVIPGIQEAPDENFVDYYMLDYRNPDNLFMATGTSQGFDYNHGAYLVTASGNRVDFNISTNGIYNDHNNWDTNRYSPAFEIANYTASTRPLMRLNNVDLNEGIDFVADVNTEGQYAVVVWFGDLTGDDQNAQIQIDNDWAAGANTAPDVNVTSPSDANYLSQYTGGYDHNISLVFSVMDAEGDELNADLYYSTSAGDFTTAIINDLNLNDHANNAALSCDDVDWTDATTCVFDWNVSAIADGNYFIDLNVFDTSDLNKVDSSAVSFYIDNTEPSTSWDGNRTWSKHDQNITLTCTDDTACASTKYRLDTNGASVVSYGAWQTYTAAGISVTDDGNYAIDFNSTDTAGNVGDTNTFYILIDKNSPAVSFTSPAAGSETAANSMNVKYSGNDSNGSGILRYWVKMDSGEYINNGTNITKNFLGLGAGSHTASVIATDNADNNSSTASVTFTLTTPAVTKRYLDVNQTGLNFEVGTADFNLFFNQGQGGVVTGFADLNVDARVKTNFAGTSGLSTWMMQHVPSTFWRYENQDTSARLSLDEDLNARVKIGAEGALMTSTSKVFDLNFTKTNTIYPNGKWYVTMIFTDTNTDATNYATTRHYECADNDYTAVYRDNDDATPDPGFEWWHQLVRKDLNSDYDSNTSVTCGYDTPSALKFFTGKWNVDGIPSALSGCTSGGGWAATLDPEFAAGEVSYLNYMLYISNMRETGPASEEEFIDSFYLDYRTPDDLFMTTGTSQGFDVNVGAYKLTASGNRVDFNISTKVGATDVNRYKPAFEISNYTASTRPLLRHNGADKNEGIDFIADVNTVGQYAVVVWMGDILTTDVNAQFQIDDSWVTDTNAPSTSWDGNASWSKYDQNIRLTCTDDSSGCASTKYRLDTNGSSTVSYGSWAAYTSAGISVTGDGNFALDFNSTDTAGNVGDTNTKYVLIDSNAPAVSFTSPAAGSSTAANSMNVKYSGNDSNGSGITKYYVRMDSGNWIDNNVNITRNFLGLTAGEHTAYVIATDNADNNSSTASVTFTLTTPAATVRHLDVNATGANFEVGTADFNLFFQQDRGGGISRLVDLNRDGVLKTNDVGSLCYYSSYSFPGLLDGWHARMDTGTRHRTLHDDNSAQLWKAEDLNSRVQIKSSGALMDWNGAGSPHWDLNFTQTNTVYPVLGGLRVAVHLEMTDTNSGATNYGAPFTNIYCTSGFVTYTDNNVTNPAGNEWWYAVQRRDLNSDFDANTAIARGYAKRAADAHFYNNKWDPTWVDAWVNTNGGNWTANSGLTTQFNAGETDYINYTLYIASTKELGQVIYGAAAGSSGIKNAPDENKIDYIMLDYRNPDNLFMTTGTSQGFDYNHGAYLVTASGNRVDFNISTNGIYNDHNNWDTNRYSPAFEISGYTASTRPLMRLNGADLNEGIDFVADVNDSADYAVVVWLGSLTGDDQNAQLQIASSWDSNAPAVSITSPASGSSTAANSMNVKYWGVDVDTGIKKYYVQMDSLGWIDNGTNITRKFFGLAAGSHTAYVIAVDNADNNSTTASVTFTLTTPAATVRHLDVNATGANFEVGTADFNMLFNQQYGGGITKIFDLNRDGVIKTNFASAVYSTFEFDQWVAAIGAQSRVMADDNGAQLWKAEDLNSRVKISSSGAFIEWDGAPAGPKWDLNFNRTYAIYPITGGLKIVAHLEMTDTNSSATNYDIFRHVFYSKGSGTVTHTDNNVSAPAGTEWWYAVQRTDLNSDFDANTAIARGYAKRAADSSFYNEKWDPTAVHMWYTSGWANWQDGDLSPEFQPGETDYVNYIMYFASTTELGGVTYGLSSGIQSAPDENKIDYIMLDYRNPDNLFMATGTSQGFDSNTGAYKVTASGNSVDFNICTNGIMNDQNLWDTNRYSPAFEIASYTASTRPLMRLNNVDLNEGIDYVSDVNTAGDYAVVVWLGDLTVEDSNAQLQVAASWNAAPTVAITHPIDRLSTTGNGITVAYSGTSQNGIAKYYVRIDTNDWIDNGTSTSYSFSGLNYAAHVVYVIANDTTDVNSATASASFTLSPIGEAPVTEAIGGTPEEGGAQGTEGTQGTEGQAAQTETIAESTFVFEQRGQGARGALAGLGIPQVQLEQAAAMSGKVIRSVEITKALKGEMLYYNSKITLVVMNTSMEDMKDVSIVEHIPKEIAQDASEINSETPFIVIKGDPIVRFMIGDINAGGETEITYLVPNAISIGGARAAIEYYSSNAPIIAGSPRLGVAESIKYAVLSSLYRYVPTKSQITETLRSAGMDVSKAAEALRINSLVTLYKGGTVIAEEGMHGTKYTTNFTIKVVNSSDKPIMDTRVLEVIPKTIAETANLVNAKGNHRVLVQDPVLEFEIGTLPAGKSATVQYEVGKKVGRQEIEELSAPVVTGVTEEPAKEEAPKDDTLLIIGLAALAVICVGAFLMKKYEIKLELEI